MILFVKGILRLTLGLVFVLLIQSRNFAKDGPPVFPTPQFYRLSENQVILKKGRSEVSFVLPSQIEPRIEVAAKLISSRLEDLARVSDLDTVLPTKESLGVFLDEGFAGLAIYEFAVA